MLGPTAIEDPLLAGRVTVGPAASEHPLQSAARPSVNRDCNRIPGTVPPTEWSAPDGSAPLFQGDQGTVRCVATLVPRVAGRLPEQKPLSPWAPAPGTWAATAAGSQGAADASLAGRYRDLELLRAGDPARAHAHNARPRPSAAAA